MQHAVAADPRVDHRHFLARGLQPFGEHVGPAAVGVLGRAVAVGDRVAQRHDRRPFGCQHLDAAEEEARRARRRLLQRPRRGLVAPREPGRRARQRMGRGGTGVAGHEEADRHAVERLHRHLDRVAQRRRAGRQRDRGPTAEGHRLVARGIDASRRVAGLRHVRGADHQRRGAELVADPQPHRRAPERQANHLPDGLVGHLGAVRQRRRGAPAPDPVLLGRWGLRLADPRDNQRKRDDGRAEQPTQPVPNSRRLLPVHCGR